MDTVSVVGRRTEQAYRFWIGRYHHDLTQVERAVRKTVSPLDQLDEKRSKSAFLENALLLRFVFRRQAHKRHQERF